MEEEVGVRELKNAALLALKMEKSSDELRNIGSLKKLQNARE